MSAYTNIDQFELELRRLSTEIPEKAILVVHRKLSLQALEELVGNTPVGNPDLWAANAGKKPGDPGYVGRDYLGGHARANWQLEIGAFPDGELPGIDDDGAATVARGRALLERLPPFSLVVIANNVPYIIRLRDGHSGQAPEGWFDLIVENLTVQLQAAA